VLKNAAEHKYDDQIPGSWGKAALVPHLQMAGLHELSHKVQMMLFEF
jgi:hypothetical protein